MSKRMRMQAKCLKWLSSWQNLVISCIVILGIVFVFMSKNQITADDGDRAGTVFGTTATGALIGGLAGGGKGAGIGAAAGLGFGLLATSGGGRSQDPYRRLEKLQNQLARTRNPARQARLQQEINDLQSRLNIAPTPGYPQAGGYGYRPRYAPQPMPAAGY